MRKTLPPCRPSAAGAAPAPRSRHCCSSAGASPTRRCQTRTTAERRASTTCSTCWRMPARACWRRCRRNGTSPTAPLQVPPAEVGPSWAGARWPSTPAQKAGPCRWCGDSSRTQTETAAKQSLRSGVSSSSAQGSISTKAREAGGAGPDEISLEPASGTANISDFNRRAAPDPLQQLACPPQG